MGKQKWTDDHFSKQLKAERERRGWTQAEVAKMLSDKDISMHWTTIAKIEKGDRSVRIDEAAGIADLFEVSVDSLLGRRVRQESDLAYTLRGLSDMARQSSQQIAGIANTLSERLVDLSLFEFEGREALKSEGDQAFYALRTALQALYRVSTFEAPSEVGQRKDFVERHNPEVQIRNFFEIESAVDETES
jgi:transcriptional regulator with XRE-family HTH domain